MAALFGVEREMTLLVEIMGIRDELNAIMSVFKQQKEVLAQLATHYPEPSRNDLDLRPKHNESGAVSEQVHRKGSKSEITSGEDTGGRKNGQQGQDQREEVGEQKETATAEDHDRRQTAGTQSTTSQNPADSNSASTLKDSSLLQTTIAIVNTPIEGTDGRKDGQQDQDPREEVGERKETTNTEEQGQHLAAGWQGTKDQGLANSNSTSILKDRSLLQEIIDIVNGNINTVDAMVKHASKVQTEV
jgi:hypothetical protein